MSKLEPSSVARSQYCHVSSQDLQGGFWEVQKMHDARLLISIFEQVWSPYY